MSDTQHTMPDAVAALFETVAYDQKKIMENVKPGDHIIGKGIYVGRWDRLGQIFNVFAAPEDLPGGVKTYFSAMDCVGTLKNWHGHDGSYCKTDEEFYAAIRNGSYNGGWIIPPRELLTGMPAYGVRGIHRNRVVQRDSLFAHKETGSFKNTLGNAWYWSSTECHILPPSVWGANFSDGYECEMRRHDGVVTPAHRLNCRPVRLEQVRLTP